MQTFCQQDRRDWTKALGDGSAPPDIVSEFNELKNLGWGKDHRGHEIKLGEGGEGGTAPPPGVGRGSSVCVLESTVSQPERGQDQKDELVHRPVEGGGLGAPQVQGVREGERVWGNENLTNS